MRAEKTGLHVEVLDCRRRKIDKVRAYRKHPEGIEVEILAPVDDGASVVTSAKDVVEFRGFVPGASIRYARI